MPSAAIQVDALGKRYRIGARVRARDLRETIRDAALGPLRRLKSFGRSSHREEDSIWALKDVSFEVRPGEVLGVIGSNGAGKTTLLRILSRITDPTEGRAVLNGRTASLLEVGTGFHQELTGRENIYLSGAILGMKKAEIDARLDGIVDFSGVEKFIETPVKRYSTGMRVRLGFAVAAHLEPEILLIDEVLAVGDVAFQKKCLGKMEDVSRGGRTVVFVSHNLASIKHLCTTCLALESGRVLAYGDVNETVGRYLEAVRGQDGAAEATGLSFQLPPPDEPCAARLTMIEFVTDRGAPADRIQTGRPLRARVHFRCEEAGRYSVRLSIQTLDGTNLLAYSMNRAAGIQLRCQKGDHYADLVVPELPLSAGHYVIGAAISIPNARWLHKLDRIGGVEVTEWDFLETGRPMTSDVCLVVAKHRWVVPGNDEGIQVIE